MLSHVPALGRATLVASFFAFLSCTQCGAPPPPDEGALALDEPLAAGEVRCGPVTRPSELIGGPNAYGSVGRTFRCYNSEIRFLLQDGSRPVGNSSYGGTLIDVDLVRGSEEDEGRDAFRELVPGYGANEVKVESIEVVSDGRDGTAGILRVSGTPVEVSIVPQAAYLRQDMPARIEVDYILRPGARYLEIKTRIINESDDYIGPVLYADFLILGAPGLLHAPDIGFDPTEELFRSSSFLALGRADHVSYAYVCSDNDIIIPLAERTISAPVCRDDVLVGVEEEYSRYVVVGDGSIESVAKVAWELRGLETGSVQGTVTDATGAVTEGAWVAAVSGGDLGEDGAFVVNEARTDDTGHFSLTLRPGTYTLVAHTGTHDRSEAKEVIVEAGADASRTLQLGGEATLRVSTSFVGQSGEDLGRLAAKLSVLPLGDTQRPSAALNEYRRHGLTTYEVSPDGRFETRLPPGRYRVFVTRGFEFTRFEADVTLDPGEQLDLSAGLAHALDTTGLVGGEFHQHSLGSTDSSVPIPIKVLENAAEGVEVTASTEHDNIVDFQPHVERWGIADQLRVMPGAEVTYTSIGHFNAYPWSIDPDDPLRDVGSRVWYGKTIKDLFDDVRDRAGDPIVQINHPRSMGAGYFASLLFDPTSGERFERDPPSLPALPDRIYEDWSADFEAIEVNGSLGSPADFTQDGWATLRERAETESTGTPVLADWFGMMGAGHHVAAMGNSDSHYANSGVGYPRSFLHVGKDAPADVSDDDVRAAVRAQRVSVGQGCLVELVTDGERRMGHEDRVDATSVSEVRVRLQAPPHVEVQRLELYVNGRVQPLAVDNAAVTAAGDGALSPELPEPPPTAPASLRLDAPLQGVAIDTDQVWVVVARGGGGLAPTGGGGTYCYSAPLYLDESGDGWVGWLEDTATILD